MDVAYIYLWGRVSFLSTNNALLSENTMLSVFVNGFICECGLYTIPLTLIRIQLPILTTSKRLVKIILF